MAGSALSRLDPEERRADGEPDRRFAGFFAAEPSDADAIACAAGQLWSEKPSIRWRRTRNGRQIELVVGDLPPCQADYNLLRQVFVNLLSNAVKFTRNRDALPGLKSAAEAERAKPAYFVRDNGVGFDMRYVDKLFNVFQRLHRVEDYEGTGVGLAIVQRIVARHGGRIWAESALDQGATFYFTLSGDDIQWLTIRLTSCSSRIAPTTLN